MGDRNRSTDPPLAYRFTRTASLVAATVLAREAGGNQAALIALLVIAGGFTAQLTVSVVRLLPAGSIIGPVMGARSGGDDDTPLAGLGRSTIALTVITLIPGVIVLGTLAVALWLGLIDGPHEALHTLPATGFTLAFIAAVIQIRRRSTPRHPRPDKTGRLRRAARLLAAAMRPVSDGVVEARCVLVARNWKLSGAVGYYAFDNAVLWAAFHAYGHKPAPSVM